MPANGRLVRSFGDLMRYAENKDRSAELLRLALPLMARQNAA